MYLLLGLFVGSLLPIQTAFNSKMRGIVQSPFLASLFSFAIGTLFLAVIAIFQGVPLLIPSDVFARTPWWAYLGGLLGMLGLTANILLFPISGSVQTVILPILGQLLMSILIDHFVLFHTLLRPLSFIRFLGLISLIVGVLLIVFLPSYLQQKRQFMKETKEPVPSKFLWQLTGIVAGMLMSTQVAINGFLGKQLHSSIHVAFISFSIGTLLVLFVVLSEKSYRKLQLSILKLAPKYVYLAGFFGASYVFSNAYLAPLIGTGAVVTLSLVGQIISSLVIDQFGLLGAIKKPIKFIQVIGVIFLFVGVLGIELY